MGTVCKAERDRGGSCRRGFGRRGNGGHVVVGLIADDFGGLHLGGATAHDEKNVIACKFMPVNMKARAAREDGILGRGGREGQRHQEGGKTHAYLLL